MKKLLITYLIISTILVITVGCGWITGPKETYKIYVTGEVLSTGEARVLVAHAPVIPWVTVNQETLKLDCFLYRPYIQGIWYGNILSLNAGDSANLKVDFIKGVATASSGIPSNFEITSHDTSQIVNIPMDSSFTVGWTVADYADYYRIFFELRYSYLDTHWNHINIISMKETTVDSNYITISMSELFPANLDSIIVSGGDLNVYAINGPKMEPGSEGNVKGDGYGFFLCETYGGELTFEIEGTKVEASKEMSREELIMKWFEKAIALDPAFQTWKETFQK